MEAPNLSGFLTITLMQRIVYYIHRATKEKNMPLHIRI
ncbi:hypothetical protein B4140_1204 [Bacillus amyloliquefaciens]|nr:hypothetical protein B4140_1204 [Bacillus amyloliquefaciens]